MKKDDPVPPSHDETAAPKMQSRLLTDHRIPELPWWAETLTILRPPSGTGPLASLDGAVRAVWRARRFDGFISANVRNALAVGTFKRVVRRRSPLLVMTEMRLDDPRPGIGWRAKVAWQRYAFAAADVLCVSSRREAALYAQRLNIQVERFRFVPWHTNVLDPQYHPPVGAAFFAAGRTGRDWSTLAAAVRGVPIAVTVVCSEHDARLADFPSNVTVCADVPYERYRSLLMDAAAVIVPLEEHAYSSGQVVVLEAMALGKPVVAARVLGTEDYIDHDVDGLLVDPGNADALRDALLRVQREPMLAERLGRAAVETVRRRHTLQAYARTVATIADESCRRVNERDRAGAGR